MNQQELNKILADHALWLRGEGWARANLSRANLIGAYLSGANLIGAYLSRADLIGAYLSGANLSRADLGGAYLSGAYLSGANLSGAYLIGANLSRANLIGANLSRADLSRADLIGAYLSGADLIGAYLIGANLSGANLSRADLSGANLSRANLSRADLSGADLSRANLSGANLSGANLSGATGAELALALSSHIPTTGAFVGWKKCRDGVIVKLQICANAKRSHATTRKCRCEYARVLQVFGAEVGVSFMNPGGSPAIEYRKGKTVRCHEWDDNRWNECSGGIHFFLTREEAEAYEG